MQRIFWRILPCVCLTTATLWFLSQALAEPSLPAPAGASAGNGQAPVDAVALKRMSYALGLSIGGDLRASQVALDLQSLSAGLADGMQGAQPKLTEEELTAAMGQFQQMMQRKAEAEVMQLAAVNRKEADQFLARNRQQEGIRETASGLQYKVIQQGNGPSPTLTDRVRTHYAGTLLDGTEFDSSYKRGEPAVFPVGGVIAGWTEALQKMHVGDKWQLWIKSDLAYKNSPPGPPIQPGHLLVFEPQLPEQICVFFAQAFQISAAYALQKRRHIFG